MGPEGRPMCLNCSPAVGVVRATGWVEVGWVFWGSVCVGAENKILNLEQKNLAHLYRIFLCFLQFILLGCFYIYLIYARYAFYKKILVLVSRGE